jgi:hypothetical protein
MSATNQFTGLPMPVFTAFGWAGEETAIQFALSQLELFIHALRSTMPRATQSIFPFSGLNQTLQNVYLAANQEIESDLHIVFNARPMSLELQAALTNKTVLTKALKQAEKQPAIWHRLITELGADWSLRVQQMQLDPDTGEIGHYQDLFKDNVTALDEETSLAVFSKALYLNGEDKWVTPIYLSRRYESEQAAAMGIKILDVMGEQLNGLTPLFSLMTGQVNRKSPKQTRKKVKTAPVESGESSQTDLASLQIEPEDGFHYIAQLKPLHLKRGFINLTPRHWPFFSINSRTETRSVTVYYEGIYDKDSAVWRMVPNDRARLVLSLPVHIWLEDNFSSADEIQVLARKLDSNEIQISLKAVE